MLKHRVEAFRQNDLQKTNTASVYEALRKSATIDINRSNIYYTNSI